MYVNVWVFVCTWEEAFLTTPLWILCRIKNSISHIVIYILNICVLFFVVVLRPCYYHWFLSIEMSGQMTKSRKQKIKPKRFINGWKYINFQKNEWWGKRTISLLFLTNLLYKPNCAHFSHFPFYTKGMRMKNIKFYFQGSVVRKCLLQLYTLYNGLQFLPQHNRGDI